MLHRFAAAALIAASVWATPALAAGKCSIGPIAELPVTMAGLQPMVPATVDGHKAMFVLDSGAFYSLITPGSAAEFGLRLGPAPQGFYLTGIGGKADVSVATVKKFVLGDIAFPPIQFIVGGSEVGGGAGLLGQNILSRADVEYDLAGGAIRFFKPSGCGNQPLEYWAPSYAMMSISDITTARFHTIGEGYLNGARIRIGFDTGASRSVLSLAAAARAGVRPGDAGVTAGGQTHGIGRRSVNTWIAPFDSLKLGDEEIHKIKLRIGDVGLEDIDMLLGADFFLSHRLYVANSQHRLYFTYNGGPVFNLTNARPGDAAIATTGTATGQTGDSRATPTDADGFSRRGAALAARRDFDGAIADFTRAIDLAPNEARYVVERARAHLGRHEPALARADLDHALTLAPDDVAAHVLRAELRLGMGNPDAVRGDLDAAARAAAPSADQRLELGELYERLDRFAEAVAQYGLWIAAHPDDSRKPVALNGRCWARALWGQQLDAALADCNAALKLTPGVAATLDSRGLVNLRLGRDDKAIADDDAALKANPKLAWSLYGRGVAKRRKGLAAEGDADIAAATAINPKLPARAKALGIAP